MFFLPISLFLVIVLIILVPVLLILLPLKIVETALGRLGIPGPAALLLFLLSLAGSLFNIPVSSHPASLDPVIVQQGSRIFQPFFGQPAHFTESIIAVNVGGAIIPLFICLLMAFKAPALPTVTATAFCTGICYLVARPVPGVGITIPTLVPPLAAVAFAFLLAPRNRAPVAYISGVLGVLIGADLMHLQSLPPYNGIMSIGGAGVFDGIFLVGILAALFA